MMTNLNQRLCIAAIMIAGLTSGCSRNKEDASSTIDARLEQAGLKDVSVHDDREKGVITLGGSVATDADKARAESIATSLAGGQVIANQILVLPPGAEDDAKKVNAALDKGIEANLEAALVAEKLNEGVRYAVKANVVTLSGTVETPELRARAERVAAGVPYVHQVVNELQVRKLKATTTR